MARRSRISKLASRLSKRASKIAKAARKASNKPLFGTKRKRSKKTMIVKKFKQGDILFIGIKSATIKGQPYLFADDADRRFYVETLTKHFAGRR